MRVCLMCGEPVAGPVVIQLVQLTVEYHKAWTSFKAEDFEDGTQAKWIHNTCGARNDIFPNLLNRNRCELCRQQFLPEESVLQVERGVLDLVKRSSRKNPFDSQHGGCVHYACAIKDWGMNCLLRLVEEAV
jgi:hypothetical protein